MMLAFKPLLEAIPTVKGPIQLVAFLFAAACMALLVRSNPDNIQSLAVSGSLSLALVALPLLFQKTIIDLLPRNSRAPFILATVALFLSAMVGLGLLTVQKAFAEPIPNAALFDVEIDPRSVKQITRQDGRTDLVATPFFRSLQPRNGAGASAFAGLVVVHDQTAVVGDGVGQTTEQPCSAVPSCLGFTEFPGRAGGGPVLIPAGADRLPMTVTVTLRRPANNVRIWWQFVQKESGDNAVCGFDPDKRPPAEGIPYLTTFEKSTSKKIGGLCHNSTDMVVAAMPS